LSKFNLSDISSRVSTVELLIFTRQFDTYYKSGVAIPSSLESLQKDTTNSLLRKALITMSQDYLKGTKLSESMAKFPTVFSNLYVKSVQAGETVGALGDILGRLVQYLENQRNLKRNIYLAIRFPMIQLVITLALIILQSPIFFLNLVTCFLIIYGIFYLITQIKPVKLIWDRIKLKIPVFGPYIYQITMSRFAWLFETANRTGLPIDRSLTMIAQAIDNSFLSVQIEKIAIDILLGQNLTVAMAKSGLFTPAIMQLVATGEMAGKLDEMLKRVSGYYDSEVERKLKALPGTVKVIISIMLAVIALLFISLIITKF
jgi:MSHA biogenesis protein MshG